jgi:hypothetical protein
MTQSDTIAPRAKSEAANAVITIFLSSQGPVRRRTGLWTACGNNESVLPMFLAAFVLILFSSSQADFAIGMSGRWNGCAFRESLKDVS